MALTPEQRRELIRKANEARRHAYAPYSGYAVGAALLTADGRIFSGVNVENASYPNGVCAERVAIYNAVSEGARDFQAIAVVTENGGSPCALPSGDGGIQPADDHLDRQRPGRADHGGFPRNTPAVCVCVSV
jgi:cytidine deaminase